MNRPKPIIFFLLLFALFALYFFKFPQMAAFDYDQEFYAKQYAEIVKKHKLTLLGIETSVGGLFVGPLYTYVSSGIYWIFGGRPEGIYLVTLFFLSFQAALTYSLFTKIKGERVGVFAGVLFLVSSAFWGRAHAPSPINFLYLAGLFFFYCLIKLKEDRRYLWWIGLILGIALHLHISLFFFFPILFIFLLWQKLWKKIETRDWLIFGFIILLFVLPFILFDLRHNLFLTKNVFKFASAQTEFSYSYLNRTVTNLQIFIGVFSNLLFPHSGFIYTLFLGIVSIYFFWKQASDYIFKAISLLFIVSFFLFTFYRGHITDYYLYFLAPPFFLVVSDFLLKIYQLRQTKIFVFLFFAMIIFQNMQIIMQVNNPYNLFIKKQAVQYLKSQTQEKTVKVYFDNDPGMQFGFEYLMDFYGVNRSDENFEQVFQIVLRRNDTRGGVEFKETGFQNGIEVVKLDN